MLKYNKSIVIIVFLCLIFFLFFVIVTVSKKEIAKNDTLIKNNIEFSGIITNLNISQNHAFGILRLKVLNTNKKIFKAISGNIVYPYAIENSIAEVYTQIPIPEIKKGYKVVVNSNKKTITFYEKDKFLYEWEISLIQEDLDIKYIEQNTIF